MLRPPDEKKGLAETSGSPHEIDRLTSFPTTSSPSRKQSSQARWNDANPQARWAHMALASAIRRGLIEREPCEVCGAEPTDGHHHDYDRPMDVTWLCRLHHRREHSRLRLEQIGGAA